MKTQTILSISFALMINAFILSGFITEKALNVEASNAAFIYQSNMESSEEALELEDWMTDDSYWEMNTEKTEVKTEEQVSEENLAIEDWMTNDNLWRR